MCVCISYIFCYSFANAESSSVEERVPIDKFEKEEMLKRYELHMQFVLKLKELAAEGASYREFLELPEAVADKKVSRNIL